MPWVMMVDSSATTGFFAASASATAGERSSSDLADIGVWTPERKSQSLGERVAAGKRGPRLHPPPLYMTSRKRAQLGAEMDDERSDQSGAPSLRRAVRRARSESA